MEVARRCVPQRRGPVDRVSGRNTFGVARSYEVCLAAERLGSVAAPLRGAGRRRLHSTSARFEPTGIGQDDRLLDLPLGHRPVAS